MKILLQLLQGWIEMFIFAMDKEVALRLMATRILIVDPDSHISSLLSSVFTEEGYDVDVAGDVNSAMCKPLRNYSLVITEVQLGDDDGYNLVTRIHETPGCQSMAIIFCTHCDGENDIIRGLNTGADDYIIKPFSLRETMARAKSVMRRHAMMNPQAVTTTSSAAVVAYNGLQIGPENGIVECDGVKLSLTRTEYLILSLLFTNRNRLFKREEIYESVWPGQSDVSARTVDVNISRLRKKLGSHSEHIVNRSGYGYGYME